MASMLALNVAYTHTTLIEPKKILKECIERQKKSGPTPCTYGYSDVVVEKSTIKRIFKAIKKSKDMKSIIRLSNSGFDDDMAHNLSEFISSGSNIHGIELLFGKMNCQSIKNIIQAANLNKKLTYLIINYNNLDCTKETADILKNKREELNITVKPGLPYSETKGRQKFSIKYQNATLSLTDDSLIITKKPTV